MGPNFQMIKGAGKIEIIEEKIYAIPFKPAHIRATHIGIYNGFFSWYYSDYPYDYEGTGKTAKIFRKIPQNATHLIFQKFKKNESGCDYKDMELQWIPSEAHPTKLHPSPFPSA